MGFPRKKATTGPVVTQNDAYLMATEALQKLRSSRIRLAFRATATAPILMHRWDSKALIKMLAKMVGQDLPRTPKDLTAEYEASWYRNTKGILVMPCRVIKAAIVEGAISTSGLVSKAELRRELRVLGHTSPITLSGHKEMDVKIARTDSGGVDVRSRALIPRGSYFDFVLDFPPTLSPDKVVAALHAAGETIGLCEWRPERGGELGTFEVEPLNGMKHVERILKDCALPEEGFKIPDHMLRAVNSVPLAKLSDQGKKAKAVIDHVNAANAAAAPTGKRSRANGAHTNGAASHADAE